MEEILRVATITLRGMWNHKWVGLATAWVVAAVAFAAILAIPDRYEASARIFVNTDSILKPLMTGLTVQPNDDQRIIMLSRIVISRPNVEKLVQQAGLDAKATSREERERIVDGAMKSLQFKGAGRDNLYTLTFRDGDPERAKKAIDLLAAMFIDSSKGGKAQDTQAAKRFIDEQIATYERKLQEAENRLKDFRVRNLGIAPGEGKDFFVRMSETNTLLSQARLELREAENGREALRRGLAALEPAAGSAGDATSANATAAADLEARIASLRGQLDGLLQKYTEGHPDVLGAQRQIRELTEQRRLLGPVTRSAGAATTTMPGGPRAPETLKVSLAQSEAAVASLSARVAEYAQRYEKLKASAALVPQLEAELSQLNRDYEVNKKNYESLVARRESANLSGEMQSVAGVSDYRLVDPPRVSQRPVWPNRRLLAPLALLLALAAGVGAAYLVTEVRPAFYDARAIREVTGLPVLGAVSLVVTGPQRALDRMAMLRFAGGVAALVGVFTVAIIAVELTLGRAT